MANTITVDDVGRLVPHRKIKRGKLIGHTDITIKRGVLRTLVRARNRRLSRVDAGRYPW
jgi:flagella basal body P-ring formation protein FlgA